MYQKRIATIKIIAATPRLKRAYCDIKEEERQKKVESVESLEETVAEDAKEAAQEKIDRSVTPLTQMGTEQKLEQEKEDAQAAATRKGNATRLRNAKKELDNFNALLESDFRVAALEGEELRRSSRLAKRRRARSRRRRIWRATALPRSTPRFRGRARWRKTPSGERATPRRQRR